MKIVLLLALVVVAGVWGSKPSLPLTWHQGAETVLAPITESFVSGDDLKDDVINAIDKYLKALDDGYDEEISVDCQFRVGRVGNMFVEINRKLPLLELGFDANFDYELGELTNEFNAVVAIVKEGENATSGAKIETPLAKIQRMFKRALTHQPISKAATPRYSMQQLFFGYKTDVIERDFKILVNWQAESFEAGYYNVAEEDAKMEQNHRMDNLWTMVAQMKVYATSDASKDSKLASHSSASVWKNYSAARESLFDIKPETSSY